MPVLERNKSIQTFFILLKAGLWEEDAQLISYEKEVFAKALEIAEEQSVIGLIAAGLEHITDVKIPQAVALKIVGRALQIEQRNNSMNGFVAKLFTNLKKNGISAVLVKGQGVAQCYERPLWRASGDVDILLDKENYEKGKALLDKCADRVGDEEKEILHKDYTLGAWEVELHGSMRSGLWRKLDRIIDETQRYVCSEGKIRIWGNGDTQIRLPSPENDVVLVFSHILQHFFKGGIGLRQVCDWCRLLYCYRDNLDVDFLRLRLFYMGVESEWKAFAALAVDVLGMPAEIMPFYDPSKKWCKNADRILDFILVTGNFGHKRDMSYFTKYPYLIRKGISAWKHTCDSFRFILIFPWDTIKTWCSMIGYGIKKTIEGK